jgi:hypothetical protein
VAELQGTGTRPAMKEAHVTLLDSYMYGELRDVEGLSSRNDPPTLVGGA